MHQKFKVDLTRRGEIVLEITPSPDTTLVTALTPGEALRLIDELTRILYPSLPTKLPPNVVNFGEQKAKLQATPLKKDSSW